MHLKNYANGNSTVQRVIYSFIFFICFFRISLINSNLYLSLIFGVGGLVLAFYPNNRSMLLKSIPTVAILFLFFMFFYSLAVDLVTGNLFEYYASSFAIRILFMIFCSILPAYFIVKMFLRGSSTLLRKIMFMAFALQLIFFAASYLIPGVKPLLYGLMGASDSVNLLKWNMETRGFGLSNEINYTSPFLMVVLSIFFFKNIFFKLIVLLTQVVNSNNTVIAAILGGLFSKLSFLVKLFLFTSSFLFFAFVAIKYLPRFSNEFANGGFYTIEVLFNKHFYAINHNILEVIAGTGVYVYGGASKYLSDMGFVIIFNYGGVIYSLLFSSFILLCCLRVGYSFSFVFLWVLVGIVLNLKGLLLGANGYVFMTFLFLFNRFYRINLKSV